MKIREQMGVMERCFDLGVRFGRGEAHHYSELAEEYDVSERHVLRMLSRFRGMMVHNGYYRLALGYPKLGKSDDVSGQK